MFYCRCILCYTHRYEHTQTHTQTHRHTHISIYIYIYIYIDMCVCIYIYIYIYTDKANFNKYIAYKSPCPVRVFANGPVDLGSIPG